VIFVIGSFCPPFWRPIYQHNYQGAIVKSRHAKKPLARLLALCRRDENGQGITEYGAIIAFVSILVALTFGLSSGSLQPAVSKAFSSVSSQLNNLSDTASSSSS